MQLCYLNALDKAHFISIAKQRQDILSCRVHISCSSRLGVEPQVTNAGSPRIRDAGRAVKLRLKSRYQGIVVVRERPMRVPTCHSLILLAGIAR